jgi:inositol polyphosphate 1-phosphatase
VSSQILLTSASDADETHDKFSRDYTIHNASGAGYKLLCVIHGLADAYVLSKNTTYKWDTCGPHAILLAQGGGVISYKSLCELAHRDFSILNKFVDIQIVYGRDDKPENFDIKNWCNSEGIVGVNRMSFYINTPLIRSRPPEEEIKKIIINNEFSLEKR